MCFGIIKICYYFKKQSQVKKDILNKLEEINYKFEEHLKERKNI